MAGLCGLGTVPRSGGVESPTDGGLQLADCATNDQDQNSPSFTSRVKTPILSTPIADELIGRPECKIHVPGRKTVNIECFDSVPNRLVASPPFSFAGSRARECRTPPSQEFPPARTLLRCLGTDRGKRLALTRIRLVESAVVAFLPPRKEPARTHVRDRQTSAPLDGWQLRTLVSRGAVAARTRPPPPPLQLSASFASSSQPRRTAANGTSTLAHVYVLTGCLVAPWLVESNGRRPERKGRGGGGFCSPRGDGAGFTTCIAGLRNGCRGMPTEPCPVHAP